MNMNMNIDGGSGGSSNHNVNNASNVAAQQQQASSTATPSYKDTGIWNNIGNAVGAPTSTVVSSPGNSHRKDSGIAAILEAIKARERKDGNAATAPAPVPVPVHSSNTVQVHDVADSSSSNSSNSTIPSTIDVTMKDADAKNAYGLSWRQHPSESFSDWTIEVVFDDVSKPTSERALYHVHRRVLAVGPKKSDYFATIFKFNGSANRNTLRLSKRQAAVFPIVLDYIYADIDFELDTEMAYVVSLYIYV